MRMTSDERAILEEAGFEDWEIEQVSKMSDEDYCRIFDEIRGDRD